MYTGVGPVRNMRNMYVKENTSYPIRFREDLDTGWVDFNEVSIGNEYVDESLFTDPINEFTCHDGWNPNNNPDDQTCVRYCCQSLRRSWPCATPTCGN